MKHILIILSVLLCGYTLAYPCGGSSCCCRDGRSSCGSGFSCCTGGGSSCCSKGRSSCCSETSCCTGGESSCCCEGGSSCCGDGGSLCSSDEKCFYPPRPSTTPTPICPTPPCPPTPESRTSHNTSVSNNNNITIPTDITIQNDVHSETHVNVPVSIVVNNQNDIQIKSDSNQESPQCCDKDCKEEEQPCTNNTKIVTVTVPVTVPTPYPVPVPVPQPYIVTVPMQQPVPTGCCTMVAPCTPYTHSGCMHNSVQCGGQCSGSVMYQPTNLCQSGCLQVPSSYGVHCGMGGCNRTPVDCSMCSGNWGQTYDMFKMCSGCFFPMGWGGRSGVGYYGK